MKTFWIILAMLCTSTVIAADWREYFRAQSGSVNYINNHSVVFIEDGKVRAWDKTVYKSGNGRITLIEVDCKQRIYTIRGMEPLSFNDFDGLKECEGALKVWTEPEQLWKRIESTDAHEAVYNTWCGKKIRVMTRTGARKVC